MIKVTLFAEVQPELAANPQALAILSAAATQKAVQLGIEIADGPEVDDGPNGTKVVVWTVKDPLS